MIPNYYTSLNQIWEEVFAIKNGFQNVTEVAKKIENTIAKGYGISELPKLASCGECYGECKGHNDAKEDVKKIVHIEDDNDIRHLK